LVAVEMALVDVGVVVLVDLELRVVLVFLQVHQVM
jgi:hypothetical protein